MAMEIATSRFGVLRYEADDLLHFPVGMWGLEDCRNWIVLGDGQHDAVAWLQSVDQPRVALAVVSPRRFVPDYRIRVARAELEPLGFTDVREAQVLAILGRSERAMTLNLKAPLVINVQRRLGRQVLTNGDLPIRYELDGGHRAWKKSA